MASAERLVITVLGREVNADHTRAWTVGRDKSGDICIDDDRVSRYHAVVRFDAESGWVLEDLGSRNGTFLDGQRIQRIAVSAPLTLRLGAAADGPSLTVTPEGTRRGGGSATGAPLGAMPAQSIGALSTIHRAPEALIRIGRADDNDLVVVDLLASRHHAELRRQPDGQLQLIDLNSHNGTFLDGQPVKAPAIVHDGSIVSVGRHLFRLSGDRLEEYVDTGEVTFGAYGLGAHTPDGKVLLEDVTFSLGANSFLAVLGPTGAGKSTLVKALTGFQPANDGRVLYNGRDLYESYPELRRRIGYVPQDDVLHPQLTVGRALDFAAKLRLPPDLSRRERADRVGEVMDELGLSQRRDVRISQLSGGQRKRTSVALELLARPSLLFLDEPTSGLDPGYEKMVMELLRQLADGGRTVVVVTHSVQSLELCHRVLFLAPGGSTAYFGQPTGVAHYFDVPDYAEVFRRLEAAPATGSDGWHSRWLADETARGLLPGPPPSASSTDGSPITASPSSNWLGQVSTLMRRYMATIAADRRSLALLLLQAPLLGLLMLATLPRNGLARSSVTNLHSTGVLLNLMLAVTFVGLSNAIREIVKELPIYRRERAAGLSVSAYVTSKVVVLGFITAAEGALMALVATLRVGGLTSPLALGSGRLELAVTMAMGGLAAMAMGLMISALVNSADKAVIALPIVLFGLFLVSTGGLASKPVIGQLADATSTKWTYDAAASTADLFRLEARPECEGQPATTASQALRVLEHNVIGLGIPKCVSTQQHKAAVWWTDVGALGVLTVIPLFVAGALLRRQDPTRPSRRGRSTA